MTTINDSSKSNNIDSCTHDIIKTLLYFDVFQYPLNLNEIISFSKFSLEKVRETVQKLITKNIIYETSNFYSLTSNYNISRRVEGNEKATKILKKAVGISKFISQFPFIEGVFISGSLSKGFYGDDDDIDYFIITSPNRLWLARTLLIGFKKIFLLNSRKYFCVNYFMSTNALEVTEKNRFTATEFVTLIPMSANGVFQDLKDNNDWILDYFPNYNLNKKSEPVKRKLFKRFTEYLLNGKVGDYLENKFMKITKNHQKEKFKNLNNKDFKIAFKSDKDTSKHHPDNHQMRVIKLLNEKIIVFNKKHQLNILLEKS